MADEVAENLNRTDPVLQSQQGYSSDVKSSILEKPELFTRIKPKIIKSVSLYLQLLWDDCSNGKIIEVYDLIINAKNLFGTRYESKDIFTTRHIAADLRELTLFSSNIDNSIKKYYKNIDVNRVDISARIDLAEEMASFFSSVVHLNYPASHEQAKKISEYVKKLDQDDIKIPDQFQKYFDQKTFEIIFENFCIIFIFNFYKIFSEFLYDDKE